MKSHTRRHKLQQVILLALIAVLMYTSQVIMGSLPNIELVSFIIVLTARKFGVKVLAPIYVFVLLEALTYGFEIWVICYLYVWAILAFAVIMVRRHDSRILYTLISGIFGFLFGILCSVPYFIIGGVGGGITWIISGIVSGFDILHGFGNLLLMFLLYKPISAVFDKANS